MSALQERRKGLIEEARQRLKKLGIDPDAKARARAARQSQAPKARLCFGSKKLFHAQFRLHADHVAWLSFILGSKDEVAGCQVSVQDDGGLTLRVRLPEALGHLGRYIEIPGVRFAAKPSSSAPAGAHLPLRA